MLAWTHGWPHDKKHSRKPGGEAHTSSESVSGFLDQGRTRLSLWWLGGDLKERYTAREYYKIVLSRGQTAMGSSSPNDDLVCWEGDE